MNGTVVRIFCFQRGGHMVKDCHKNLYEDLPGVWYPKAF